MFGWSIPLRQVWLSSNLPLFLLVLPPPLLAAQRWTPVHNKKLHINQLTRYNPVQDKQWHRSMHEVTQHLEVEDKI